MTPQDARTRRSPPRMRVPKLPKTTVIGIFGPKGSGKSLLAAMLARRQYRRSGGNRPLLYFPEDYNHEDGEFISLPEMYTGSERMRNAIIIWDEAQVLLNKFRSMTHGNRSLLAFLQQIRKRGCHLYYTSNAPKQLDRALGEQTDWHAFVEILEDSNCAKDPLEHIPNCHDTMVIDWVDTQGAHGYDARFRDGRFRDRGFINGLVNWYGSGLYNTFATADLQEVASMDADAIRKAHDEKGLGIPYPEFVSRMVEWIEGQIMTQDPPPKWLIPARFAETIAKQTKNKVTPSANTVGLACRDLGLAQSRSNKARRYELPAKIDVERGLWRVGLA